MITEKLIAIQQALKAPKGQYNSFGGYNYRSCEDILEAVKPILAKEKVALTISDEIVEVGGRIYVKATATLHDPSDANVIARTSAYSREEESKKGMDAAQLTGATSSYARKYALNGLFAIDDNNDADATNTHGKAEPKKEYPAEAKAPKTAPETPRTANFFDEEDDGPFCSDCGARISDKVKAFSVKKYGRALCMDCQKNEG